MLPISMPEGERFKEPTLVRSLNPLKDEVTIEPARGDELPDLTADRWTARFPQIETQLMGRGSPVCRESGLGCVRPVFTQQLFVQSN